MGRPPVVFICGVASSGGERLAVEVDSDILANVVEVIVLSIVVNAQIQHIVLHNLSIATHQPIDLYVFFRAVRQKSTE